MMKVLLISPKDPKTPTSLKFLMGGESTYTTTLLSHPPAGVDYIHHLEALKKGEIEATGFSQVSSWLIKARVMPPDAGVLSFRLKKTYDLIHCHAYSLKIEGKHPPVILGDSSCNFLYLRDYLGWSLARIRFHYRIRKIFHRQTGVYDQALNLADCRRLIVFSKFAKKVHLELGADPKRVEVIPPGLQSRSKPKRRDSQKINILFAGVWFERKGGMILLEAFRQLAKKYQNIYLGLLGPLPKGMVIAKKERIEQKDFVSYQKLIKDYYPWADIFVLVPPKAEGYGLVVEEAMSFGIPTVVSDVYALPEMVEDSKTGFVVRPGDKNDLAEKLKILIEKPQLRKKMGRVARKRFLEKFWLKRTNEKLLKVYQEAMERRFS